MTEAPHENRSKSRGISRYALALIPLVAFCGIAETAAKMLYDQDFHAKNIAEIPSALIGTKAPSLNLPPLEGSSLPALTYEAVKGKLTLVNVFAFWCIPLRVGPFYDLSLKEGLFPAMEKAGLSISLIIHPPGAID